MRTRGRHAARGWAAPLMCITCFAALAAPAPPPSGYLAPGDVVSRLQDVAAASDRAHMVEIAKTDEGRGVFALAIGENDAAGRPGILILADPDGDRPIASQIACNLAERLASSDELTGVASVYIVPVANPDGAARAFAGEDPWRGWPVDEDRDGRTDEDPAEDLNDDGHVLQMRVADPTGKWRVDEHDPRAMVEADAPKGEVGGYRLLTEGIDNDSDRGLNEDGPGGVRLDANWPHRWQEHARDAGPFQLSEPETHGLIEFMLSRPNISVVIVLGSEDNTADAVDGADDSDPDSTEPLKDDADLLKLLGDRLWDGEDAKPRGAAHSHGGFADWAYYQFGALVIESAVWSPPLDADEKDADETQADDPDGDTSADDNGEDDSGGDAEDDGEEDDDMSDAVKLLAWGDATYAGAAFVDWSPFRHPDLGDVEIGGWLPLTLHNPPADAIAGLVDRWETFVLSLADDLPRVEWVKVEVSEAADRLFDARATLVNGQLFPTVTVMGERTRRPLPIRVSLELPEGGELVAGRARHTVARLKGRGDAREFRWLYRLPRGVPDARIRAISQAAGQAVVELEVTR